MNQKLDAGTDPGFTLRPAEPKDVEVIVKMVFELAIYERAEDECHATVEAMHEQLFGAQPHAEAYVAEIEGKVGAMAIFFFNFSTWDAAPGLYLEDLFVRPTYRRLGIGRAMLERLAFVAKQRGCTRFEWSVLDWNKPARDLYETMGAKPMTEWVRYRMDGKPLADLAETGAKARKEEQNRSVIKAKEKAKLRAEMQGLEPAELDDDPASVVAAGGIAKGSFDPEGKLVTIHTDGGATPNPGVGAWAAILQAGSKRVELTGGELGTTNNRMEMLAAINALEALVPGQQVLMYTDSQYLKNGITTWIKNWKKNNWMRGKGRDLAPVKNAELWKRLDAITQKHRLGWEWVKGHAGNELNERCDVLCSAMMDQLVAGSTKAERAAALEELKKAQEG